jgi:hypothetical protein
LSLIRETLWQTDGETMGDSFCNKNYQTLRIKIMEANGGKYGKVNKIF